MPLTSASAFARPSTHHHPLLLPSTVTPTLPRPRPLLALSFRGDGNCLRPVRCCHSAVSKGSNGALDPELRFVLELATDSELYEIERILFGPSYFSPLLKSITSRGQLGHSYIEEDLEERDDFIAGLESRFLFLAADARSTLRGWRPSYRNVLLAVREKLNVPCSRKLSTEDLEAEIFLHVLKVHASEFPSFWEELQNIIIKGSGILTLSKLYQVVSTRLTGNMLLEAASYQVKREFIKKSGQLASINLESRAALIAAKQGLSGAASRYLGLRSMMHFLGPICGELFWLMLSFKCLELTMLESCQLSTLLHRSVLLAHILYELIITWVEDLVNQFHFFDRELPSVLVLHDANFSL